jgi:hypothetical protein
MGESASAAVAVRTTMDISSLLSVLVDIETESIASLATSDADHLRALEELARDRLGGTGAQ